MSVPPILAAIFLCLTVASAVQTASAPVATSAAGVPVSAAPPEILPAPGAPSPDKVPAANANPSSAPAVAQSPAASTTSTMSTASLSGFDLDNLNPLVDADRTRLVVLVTFDHFRADYLTRFFSQFGRNGFRRMIDEGYWARDCRFRNAVTTSAPGHAVLATGAYPDRTGIVGDAHFEPAYGRMASSVEDPREHLVAGRSVPNGRAGVSPRGLAVPTVADMLRAATQGRGKVVALSMIDHAAVLLGGSAPDRLLWWDGQSSQFVTSSFYAPRLDPWVLLYDDSLRIRDFTDARWDLLRPESWYSTSRRDDAPYEFAGLGRTFPHVISGSADDPRGAIYQRLTATPLGDELLFELAEKSIGADRLGADGVPDLLCLSFGSSSVVSRAFGPFSREAQDMVLRTDRLIARLLAVLDRRMGEGAYTVILVGSGGVAPIPEAMAELQVGAGRILPRALMEGAERHLRSRFPSDLDSERRPFLAAFASSWIWLNDDSIRARGLAESEVREALRDYLATQDGIASAYTIDQLATGRVPAGDFAARAFSRDLFPGRSGDVVVLSKPYWIISPAREGTASGTPYGYDQRVALLAYGKGVERGTISREPVGAEDVAATLSALLGIEPPPCCEGAVLPGALDSARP